MHCWQECKLVQLLWKRVWRFIKKLKTELPYDTAISHHGIYSKKTTNLKRHKHCYGHCSTYIIAKARKQPKRSLIDEWISGTGTRE